MRKNIAVKNIFKTGKSLQWAIDNADKYPEIQDYLDMNFAYLMFDLDGKTAEEALNGELFEVPYWIEKYHGKHIKSGENKYWGEYIPDIHEPLEYGDIHEFKKGVFIPAGRYEYVDSQSLSEEEEHQAENGDLVYEYRGYSFMRIWKLLE